MIPSLTIMRDMLSCVRYSGDKHTSAKIKENDPSAQLRTVNIIAANGDWFLFAPDKGRGKAALMSPLLAASKNHQHHRACDAVIVALKNDNLKLVFVDLKSSAPGGYSAQFQSSRQFTRYLLGLLKEFHDISFSEIEERFLIFHTPKAKKVLLNKKPSVLSIAGKPSRDPKKPQKEVVSDGVSIYLKQLLG